MEKSHMVYDILESDWGPFLLAACNEGLCVLDYQNGPKPRPIQPHWKRDSSALIHAEKMLLSYLKGECHSVSIPFCPEGTPFQKEVWKQLATIPYGQTVSYSDIALSLGKPDAVRAVGHAIGQNPIQIFIPCHRVIGKNGKLTGYAGGLAMKQRLLDLEGYSPK